MADSERMLGLADPLQRLVTQKFTAAYTATDLVFSPTSLAHLRARDRISFQLRYCPALKRKPREDESAANQSSGPMFDPFADPSPELLIARIPTSNPTHALVLNKYPVIHNHFIIATKADKPQTGLLEEDDLGLTYACLHAWRGRHGKDETSRLFAFFNSGEHSGASQVHRHLQFLPVEDMASSDSHEWTPLIDRMTVRAHPEIPLFQEPSLPILHLATPLEEGASPSELHRKYMLLLRAALSATRFPGRPVHEGLAVERDGRTLLSYNLAMTKDRMAIFPRSQEAVGISGAGPESSVAVNGTILAATLMVKDETEWDILRDNHTLLDRMLTSIGYPLTSWQPLASGTKI